MEQFYKNLLKKYLFSRYDDNVTFTKKESKVLNELKIKFIEPVFYLGLYFNGAEVEYKGYKRQKFLFKQVGNEFHNANEVQFAPGADYIDSLAVFNKKGQLVRLVEMNELSSFYKDTTPMVLKGNLNFSE